MSGKAYKVVIRPQEEDVEKLDFDGNILKPNVAIIIYMWITQVLLYINIRGC